MSITHTITKTWAGQSGAPITKAVQFSASEELNLDFQLTAGQTNQQENLAFTKTLLQSIFIQCDQAITVKTNSSGSPQDTLNLAANDPFQWDINSGLPSPFAGNVTTAFFTNDNGTTVANVSVRCLTNG